MGVRADTFGHIIITNVGMMGYQSAHAPLCPVIHAMGLLCTGVIEKRAIVDQKTDAIKVAKMMTCVGTGDHRYGDAAIFVPLFRTLRAYIEDPLSFDINKMKANVHYSELKQA